MKLKLEKIIFCLIYLYVFLLPWQTVWIFDERFIGGAKWQWGTGQIYATEIILWVILILFFISYFLFPISKNNQKIFKLEFWTSKLNTKRLLTLSIWLFIFYSGLSIIWSAEKWPAYYLWLHWLEGAALFLVLIRSKIEAQKILWALSLSGAIQAIMAIGQFLAQSVPANKWLGIAAHSAGSLGEMTLIAGGERWLRAYGALPHPNILGGFLLLSLLAAVYLSLRLDWRSPLKRLSLSVLAAIIAAGIFFSFSRSAWLAAAIAIAFLAAQVIKLKDFRRFTILTAPLLSFAILALIFAPLIISRFDAGNRFTYVSGAERLSQNAQALSFWSQAPLGGVGLNNYTWRLARVYPGQPAYDNQPAHNIYLLLAAELGLVGLAAFLLLAAAIGLAAWRRHCSVYYLLPFVCWLIIGVWHYYPIYQYAGIILLFLAAALPFLFESQIPESAGREKIMTASALKKTIKAIICICGAAAIALAIFLIAVYLLSHSTIGVTAQDRQFISEAYAEASLASTSNDYPVGAIITDNGKIIAQVHNTVQKEGDSRNHAEMVAISEALNKLGIGDFSQATGTIVLYTTYEPCPMCEGYIVWKKVPRVVVGKRKGFTKLAKENFLSHLLYRFNERGGIDETIHDQLDAQYQHAQH